MSTTPTSGRTRIRQWPRLRVDVCGAVRYVPTAPTARYSVSAAGAEDRPRADQHSAGSGDPSPRAGDPGDDHRPGRDEPGGQSHTDPGLADPLHQGEPVTPPRGDAGR